MDASFLGIFSAGVLTFLSPCVLPLMPILLASLMAAPVPLNRHQRLHVALWFVGGFSLVFVLMGLSIPSLAQAIGALKPWLLLAAGALLALFGLKMMRALPEFRILSWMNRSLHLPDIAARARARLPGGLYGLLFGAIFGLSWTPCVGPVLGGVLTYVASREATPFHGALLLFSFALGIGLPILALAWASDKVLPWLNRLKRHLPKIEYAIGLGLFFFGVYMANQGRLLSAATVEAVETGRAPIVAVDQRGASVALNSESNHRARVLFFYSEHCPVCHAMERYLPEFESECAKGNFELIRINTGDFRNAHAARAYSVKAVPTVSILNDRGDEVVHLIGYQPQSRLIDALKTTSQMACKAKIALPMGKEPLMNSACGTEGRPC